MGKDWLRPFLETSFPTKHKKANKENKEKMCHDAHESLAAVVMLQGANHDKHGSLKATMQTFASLGEEKYPKTLKDMNAAIGKHPWDRKPDGQRNQKTKGAGKELQLAQTTNSEPICYCLLWRKRAQIEQVPEEAVHRTK